MGKIVVSFQRFVIDYSIHIVCFTILSGFEGRVFVAMSSYH